MSAPASHGEQERIERWLRERVARRLKVDPAAVDSERTFDSYGLGSADAVELSGELEEFVGRELDPTLAYEHPTIRAVARAMVDEPAPEPLPARRRAATHEPIAVVGMACRFPGGGDSPDELWRMLAEGRDGGRVVPPERWDADEYLDPDPAAPGKAYTQDGGFVDDVAGFDAELFGLAPAEALRMDPQQRMLLELAWAALEDAGVAPDRLRGTRTGVFVGLMESMQYTQLQLEAAGAELLNDPFFAMGAAASVAAGRIAYLLDLRGPAVALDTACSSSLVCTHLAVQSLRQGDSDFALVGGASLIAHPQVMVQACKMGMLARDGRVKAFDANADGFLLGEGSGVVALERLSDATENGHQIRAVIEGSAVNQDGRSNGITAPSRAAQAAVIRAALDDAGVDPHDLDYVEAHGSGTGLGDAIEVGALRDVFGERPEPLPPLRIGSVKTNVGHLQAGAGAAGLIKTVLMLERAEVPRTLHLSELNPALKLEGTRIAPATEHSAWPPSMRPRRAGISSFGWSGTNAHAVVQAPPRRPARRREEEPWQPLALSAATPAALADLAAALRDRLAAEDAPLLQDAAYSLAVGRATLGSRRALLCRDADDALRRLAELDPREASPAGDPPRVGFFFPRSEEEADDAIYDGYSSDPAFRAALERVRALAPNLPMNGRGPVPSAAHAAVDRLALDYATAELWQAWGVAPGAALGFGDGRYAAAVVAGVLSIDDAVHLVVEREKLLAGQHPDAADRFATIVSAVPRRAPRLPLTSSTAGGWITEAEVADPRFWVSEMRSESCASNGISAMTGATDVVLELAPGSAANGRLAVGPGRQGLLRVAAELWERGAPVDWEAVFDGHGARRVRLPTYPFRHTSYWPDKPAAAASERAADAAPEPPVESGKRPDLADWCYAPVWRESLAVGARSASAAPWLVLSEGGPLADIAAELRGAGAVVTVVTPGGELSVTPGGDCVVDPGTPEHLGDLLERLRAADAYPERVVHGWAAGPVAPLTPDCLDTEVEAGFASLMSLAQAIARTAGGSEVELIAATTGAARVLGTEPVAPARAMVASLARCIPAEQPSLRCRAVDLELERAAEQLLAEIRLDVGPEDAAWRGARRWARGHEAIRVEPARSDVWRPGGVYLITGGLGGLGLALARHLAESVRARLALVGRSERPESDDALIELERAGAEVLTLAADVADADAAAEVVRRVKERFGAIHGVVHAAGVPGGGLFQWKTREGADAVLRPKVHGTVALCEALRGERLDFVALYSSAAAVLGGLGESDYAPANAFMDAFAEAPGPGAPRRVVSIGWGAWAHDTWQQRIFADAPELARRAREYRDRLGIGDDEGIELLTRLIASPLESAMVLPQDPETTTAAIAALASADALAEPPPKRQVFPRPDLRWPYRAPGTAVERQLATIWSEQLGIDRVGLDDPFFELGGNSLIGLSILARVETELGTALPPASLFERPTVGQLAELLGARAEAAEQRRDERLAEVATRGERRRQMARAAGRRNLDRVGDG